MQAFTNEGYACRIYNETDFGTKTFLFYEHTKQALESRLLSMIGAAAMEKELQKTIAKINHNIDTLE
jgi:hypothetical protein